MTDETVLIAQLKNEATSTLAFSKLLDQYKKPLYWHIRKIVITHQDADDVLQNTFIKVYKNIKQFKGESKIFSWMYRIATNEAITHLNREAKLKKVDIDTVQENKVQQLTSDPFFDGDEVQIKLQEAIATLPYKQKLVFNMRYFDELKYEDMAEILDSSVGSLKASYHHAKKKIEAYFDPS